MYVRNTPAETTNSSFKPTLTFQLAVKAVPYRSDFLTSLGTTEQGLAPHKDVIRDMKVCVEGLTRVTNIINQLYRKHKLDSEETV